MREDRRFVDLLVSFDAFQVRGKPIRQAEVDSFVVIEVVAVGKMVSSDRSV